MSDLYWLTNEQMDRLRLFPPKATANPTLMTAAC